jgi:phage gpG-like protein
MGVGVTVDASEVEDRLDNLLDALGKPGMRELGRFTERAIQKSVNSSFSTRTDPETGAGWARRKGSPSWAPLQHTGGLKRSLYTELEVEKDGFYASVNVRDIRSGSSSYHAIAGVHYYGRKDQRQKIQGRGNKRGKGGPVPRRRFAGISKPERIRIREAARKLIRKT